MKWIPIHELLMQCRIGPARASGIIYIYIYICPYMLSLDVMWYLPSEERGINLHGRHGMYLMARVNSRTIRKTTFFSNWCNTCLATDN